MACKTKATLSMWVHCRWPWFQTSQNKIASV